MTMRQHLLRFPATLAGLEETTGTLSKILDDRGVDDGARYHVELVFEEVAANIVRYGSPTGEIEAAVRFDDDEIVLTFEDDGVPFDPRRRSDPALPSSIDEAPVGGLGLVLLRTVVTRMTYERTQQERNLLTLAIPAR